MKKLNFAKLSICNNRQLFVLGRCEKGLERMYLSAKLPS